MITAGCALPGEDLEQVSVYVMIETKGPLSLRG
jgi:hypothetical protein